MLVGSTGDSPRRPAQVPGARRNDGDVTREGTAVQIIYPDPLDAMADCHDVANELGRDPDLVEAIHAHRLAMDGRPPEKGDLAVYVARLVSSVGEAALRKRLGLPMAAPVVTTTPSRRPPATVVPDVVVPASGIVRRRGRPGWTAELFWARYQEARSRTAPPYVDEMIAHNFRMLDGTVGTDRDYLSRLVRRFGLPRE